MGKKKKENFDAASLNKRQYIRDNYVVKEDEPQEGSSNKKRQKIIVSMLSVLLLVLVSVLSWVYFFAPQKTDTSIDNAASTPDTTPPSATTSLYAITPTPRPVLTKFEEYFEEYPDIVGWISIDNIKVDYPVVQSPNPNDPHKYLTLGPDETPSDAGAIYLDIRNSIDAGDRHIIIYGHNMKNGSMFGQLKEYLSRTFYQDHLIIRYDTLYQELEWEVINVFETTTDFYYIQTYFRDDTEFVNLIQQCIYKNYFHDQTTVINPEDIILTLSTCTNDYEDGRLVIQAKLITPLEGNELTETAEPSETATPNP